MIDTEMILVGGTSLTLLFVILLFSLSFQTPYNKELRYLAPATILSFLSLPPSSARNGVESCGWFTNIFDCHLLVL